MRERERFAETRDVDEWVMIREKSRCTIFTIGFHKPESTRNLLEKSHCTIFYHWIPETRNLLAKNPIAPFFTIGFQKPGICADSWFLESNGKKWCNGIRADSWFLESNCKNWCNGIFF